MRAVKSPLAPKMTIEQGSKAFRDSPRREAWPSSLCPIWFTGDTIAERPVNINDGVERGLQSAAIAELLPLPIRSGRRSNRKKPRITRMARINTKMSSQIFMFLFQNDFVGLFPFRKKRRTESWSDRIMFACGPPSEFVCAVGHHQSGPEKCRVLLRTEVRAPCGN